jgi:hypothetical protein
MSLSPVYELIYSQPTEETVVIGEFDSWEMLASLLTEECTMITEESGNTELTLMLSCWFMKMQASDAVQFADLTEEKMVYTYPESGITGGWSIRLLDTGIEILRTESFTNREGQNVEIELEKSTLNGESEYNVRTSISTLTFERTATVRTIIQSVSSWESKINAINEMRYLMMVNGYEAPKSKQAIVKLSGQFRDQR